MVCRMIGLLFVGMWFGDDMLWLSFFWSLLCDCFVYWECDGMVCWLDDVVVFWLEVYGLL